MAFRDIEVSGNSVCGGANYSFFRNDTKADFHRICSKCILPFATIFFDPATGAYCIPTGLLRALGYFRGNAFETLYAGSTEEKTV